MNSAVLKKLILTIVCTVPTLVVRSADLAAEHFSLGRSYQEINRLDKAREHYEKTLQLQPNHAQAAFNLGTMLYNAQKKAEAVTYLQQAAHADSHLPHVFYTLGRCYLGTKQYAQALSSFDTALMHDPTHALTHLHKAAALEALSKPSEAITAYQAALAHDNSLFEAHYQLGRLLRDQEQFQPCVAHFRSAHHLDPRHVGAILELANTLNMLDQPQECLELYKQALELAPQSLAALYNYGYTLKKVGQVHEALEVYNKVLTTAPDYALARFSRALLYLSLGDFERGWQEYEWRWKAYNETPRSFIQPLWDGSSLQGKRILLYAEQGLGDSFQFIRYAKILKDQGAYVIFHAQKALKQILSLCPYLDEVVIHGDPVPTFDVQAPLMSLPLLCKTRVETVPATIPYLYAHPNLVDLWKEKLATDKNFKIGICWQGNANYSTQFLRQAVAAKSMKLHQFAPLLKLEGITVYSLQKIYGEDQLNDIDPGWHLVTFDASFDEAHGRFMDTAALICNLDLVVTIDTSIAHLAAALGVPVWVPLPYPADWRWMLERSDTPWYPNMRLFRQRTAGNWELIMQEIAHEVQQQIARSAEHKKNKQIPPKKYGECVDAVLIATLDQEEGLSSGPTSHDLAVYTNLLSQHASVRTLSKDLLQINATIRSLYALLHSYPTVDEHYALYARELYYAWNKKQMLKDTLNKLDRST